MTLSQKHIDFYFLNAVKDSIVFCKKIDDYINLVNKIQERQKELSLEFNKDEI